MIFEFFKRLFWKADESNRKRKTSDCIFTEDTSHSKKHCHDFVSCNRVKILNKPSDSFNPKYKMNLNCYACSTLVHKQSKNKCAKKCFESTIETNLPDENKCIVKENCTSLQKFESLNQLTLLKTHRLIERKQYSEMLLNFIPPEIPKVDKEFKRSMSKKHAIQVINLNENVSSVSLNSRTSVDVTKMHSYNSWFSVTKSTPLKMGYEKSLVNNNLEKDEEKENYIKSVIDYKPIEIIKTNTLRDKFLTKDVMKQDFISQITNRYNKRMEEKTKEVEELKKMTYILSKHNQLTREAALEDHLNRSMRLCEAVLDEKDSIQESKLPILSEDMLQRIKEVLSMGSSDEIIVENFGLRITRKDMQTLAGLNWLNDEIINFYMNLLIIRGNHEKYPSVYAMNTFFYPKLISGGHISLKRWTRKIDIFEKDLIVIPIHLGIHWCLAVIDFRNKTIAYYDSMGSPNYKCLQVLKQYLYDESIDKKKKTFDFLDWNFECIKDIPQQMNGSDCGVFSCMFAEYICANRNFNFSQEQMPYFRNKMVYEILTIQLL